MFSTRPKIALFGLSAILVLWAGALPALGAGLGRAPFSERAADAQVIQAAGARLEFGAQPGGGMENQSWQRSPVVLIRDASGFIDSSDSSTVVTLAITPGTGAAGATLTCDTDQSPADPGAQFKVIFGTALFFGCRIDKASTQPYTLTATAQNLTSAVSAQFTISSAPTPTPTPTPKPEPPPPPVTQDVGPEGGRISVGGGTSQEGGLDIDFPPSSFSSTTSVTVSLANSAPAGVTASGGTLLPKTIDVIAEGGAGLASTVEIQVNLTAQELAGRNPSDIKGGVVVGSAVEPRPTRVINSSTGIVGVTVDHFSKFTLFAVTNPGPVLTSPAAGGTLSGFTANLTWTLPAGSTQYQLQIAPFNNDGPGVNVIRNADSSFTVPAPPSWYGLLPDMLYFWRVRSTTVTTTPSESDWTAWSSRIFRTPKVSSDSISPVTPTNGGTVNSLTPAVTWGNTNSNVFYYEVQVSKDAGFNTDPATATAMVHWLLIHGGVTTPLNSYQIPPAFPLEAGTTYHWRVRPRVQGDGDPLAWSQSWEFRTP